MASKGPLTLQTLLCVCCLSPIPTPTARGPTVGVPNREQGVTQLEESPWKAMGPHVGHPAPACSLHVRSGRNVRTRLYTAWKVTGQENRAHHIQQRVPSSLDVSPALVSSTASPGGDQTTERQSQLSGEQLYVSQSG